MSEIIKILLVMLVSSVKFLAGPPIAYYGQLSEFSFLETNIYCISGGTGGVLFFMFLSTHIANLFSPLRNSFSKNKDTSSAKLFSRRNRRFVKFWRSYGLLGIAFITPVVLSIPIGTFIAVRLNSNKKKIFLCMLGSIIFWSLILTSLMELIQEIPFERITGDDKVQAFIF